MQIVALNQEFRLDGNVVENMQNNFTAMMAYWNRHPLSSPYATRSYLKRVDCQDSEYLLLPEYGHILPRTFPIVNYKEEENKRLDCIMLDSDESALWQKVRFPFEKEPVKLPREEVVKSFSRFEFDVANNPRRLVYYHTTDEEIYFILPLIAILKA